MSMIVHEVTQGELDWFKIKAGKPGSSRFGSLVTGEGKLSTSLGPYAVELAAEKYVMDTKGEIIETFGGTWAMKQGKLLEPEARADYAMQAQVHVEEVGFITDDLLRWGSSTDGLINDDGVLEIKNLTATSMIKLLVYLKHNYNRTEPSYIPQCQGELFVTGREWVDLMFYNPQFDPVIHRIYPDYKFHKTLEAQLKKVIAERNRILKLIKS